MRVKEEPLEIRLFLQEILDRNDLESKSFLELALLSLLQAFVALFSLVPALSLRQRCKPVWLEVLRLEHAEPLSIFNRCDLLRRDNLFWISRAQNFLVKH